MLWLVRLINRFRPREGWLTLILAWAAVSSLPAAAIEGKLVVGLEPTLWLTTLGLLAGWWLAHRRIRGLFASGWASLVGVIADLIWGVHALTIWPLFEQVGRWLAWRLGERTVPAPALTYLTEQWASLLGFGQRVGWWVHGAISGQGVADNLVLVGVAGLLSWGVAAWAGWWLARHGRPFVALLPTGALLAQQVYYSEKGLLWLAIFLGSVPLLLTAVRLGWLMQTWEASDLDYSPEIRLEAVLTGVVIAGLVLAVAAIPFPSPRQVSDAFWRTFAEPYRRVEKRLERSFPGVQSGRSLVPPTGVAAGGLPRAHLLGGRPELGQEIALHVWVHGARGDERLYWRGQTFARYNGHGWQDAEPLPDHREFAAGESWITAPLPAGRHLVLTSVEVLAASRSVLYATGEPVSADRPYQAIQRAPGELIALRAPGSLRRYTVLGAAAEIAPDLLRAAATNYSPEIASLYLQLPADLPPELAEFAAQTTAGAPTPYERALAIESALRKIPYSLDVPAPPADREVASWFLFDLRKGYCDYYATAMVVLARLSGIPARLAVGYATGTYDPRLGGYVVTELEAHSWPELYFPGYGWVPFEPTAARPLPLRQAQVKVTPTVPEAEEPIALDTGLAELRQIGKAQAAATTRTTWAGRLLGALNLLLAFWLIYRWFWINSLGTAAGVAAWYARLARWGRRLGRPLRAADTPREYAAALAEVAASVAARAHRRPERAAEDAAIVHADGMNLAQTFEQTLYAPAPGIQPSPAAQHGRWDPLWAALRRLWLARWKL